MTRTKTLSHRGNKYIVRLCGCGDFTVSLAGSQDALFVGQFKHGILDCEDADLTSSLADRIENALASLTGDPNAED